MDTRNESFEDRVATLLERIAIDVREPVGGPSQTIVRRVHRRMTAVAVGTALLASALGVAGTMVFGFLTGEGPVIFPHAQRPWQHAFAGSARGDQPYRDHAVGAILFVQQLTPRVVAARPAPKTPTAPVERVPRRSDQVAAGGDPGLRVIIAGGQFRHRHHHGDHRRHHGHHRHHRGGHRRMH